AQITLLIGAGTRELMLKLLARCLLDEPVLAERVRADEVLARFEAHYADTTGSQAVPYEGCHETLARLKAAGVRLACVTNKESRHATRVLHALGLDGCFDLVVGGDSLPWKKPHGGVLRHVVQRLGGDTSRSAHVGDSRIDIEAARNAGVAAWAVPHGYNAGEPIAHANPQRLFANLPQVAEHVLALRRATV
ncbi:MAG TPA: HAD-IA family hydrolase, partial [Albitalea sp.]|nr:HAD-IA family hydrolase [Albitalea sp.]